MPKPTLKSGGPPTKGLALKLNPYQGSPGLLECQGFYFDEVAALTKWLGLARYNTTQLVEGPFGPASIRGLTLYVTSTGLRQVIVGTAHGLYRLDAGVLVPIPLPPGVEWAMHDHEIVDFVTLRDQLYICNGFSPNLRYDGQTCYRMGIAAPATAPIGTTGPAGVLTGNYEYRVTFYNPDTGQESNPSPSTGPITATNTQILLSQIPVSDDPQVKARRIYRTTANGGVFLFLAQLDDNTTRNFADNLPDSQLDIALEEFDNGVPPVFSMMAVYKGRIFGVPRRSSRVYFSANELNPAGFNSNDFRDLDANDGSYITALHRLYDTLVAFKGPRSGSIWNGTGENRETFGFVRQVHGVGTTNQHAVVTVPGKTQLFFPYANGIYSYDGVGERYESGDIEPLWRTLNHERLWTIQGEVYADKNVLVWFVPVGASTRNELAIVYDYTTAQWTTRDFRLRPIHSARSLVDPVSGAPLLLVGGHTGFIWIFDQGLSDDGQPITAVVVDRPHPKDTNLADDDEEKVFFGLVLLFKPQAGSQLQVSYQVNEYDPAGLWTPIGQVDLSDPSGKADVRFRAYGQRLYVRFDATGVGQPVVLRDWRVLYKLLGRTVR